jgi:hypothetical protein
MRGASLLLACLLAASPAVAQEKRAAAKAKFEEGLRHYQQGDYAQAVAAWEASYALVPAPLLLFNLGNAHRLNGDCPTAVSYYDRYLADDPNGPKRAEAEEAKRRCAEAAPAATPAAPAAEAPAARPPAPRPEPTPAPEGGMEPLRVGGLVTAGVGLALVATGVVFALQASAAANDVESPDCSPCNWDLYRGVEDRGRQRALLSKITIGAGAAAVVGGGILWFLAPRRAAESGVQAALLPGGAQLGWSASF